MRTPNQRKYRSEKMEFRTPTGIRTALIVVTAGDNERKRMIAKGEKMAKEKGWILR